MRMIAVKMLLITSIGISSSGCTGVYFSQCKTPDVTRPVIDNTRCNTYECVYDKTLINYESMKAYAEKLYNANNVCK